MTFYERYEMLCSEHGMKPQTQEMLDIAGVKSPSVSGVEKRFSTQSRRSLPSGKIL